MLSIRRVDNCFLVLNLFRCANRWCGDLEVKKLSLFSNIWQKSRLFTKSSGYLKMKCLLNLLFPTLIKFNESLLKSFTFVIHRRLSISRDFIFENSLKITYDETNSKEPTTKNKGTTFWKQLFDSEIILDKNYGGLLQNIWRHHKNGNQGKANLKNNSRNRDGQNLCHNHNHLRIFWDLTLLKTFLFWVILSLFLMNSLLFSLYFPWKS